VLIVDDDRDICSEIEEYLTDKGYKCRTAHDAAAAQEILLASPDVNLVITDIRMPGQDGLDLLSRIKTGIDRNIGVIVMTGHGEKRHAIQALRSGACDFIEKPIDIAHLHNVVREAKEDLHRAKTERRRHDELNEEVVAKALKISSLESRLNTAYEEAVACLVTAADTRDPETGNHIRRIGAFARLVAEKLGWPEDRLKTLELAAPLHDVGKIGTPDSILLKPGKLTADEFEIMKTHAEIGYRVLSRSSDPVMKCAAVIARGHHEHWDGSGYPSGLKAGEIPLEARIVAIADVYDALRSERPYKPPFPHEKAVSIMLKGDGRVMPGHFDPALLEIFRQSEQEFASIYSRLAD